MFPQYANDLARSHGSPTSCSVIPISTIPSSFVTNSADIDAPSMNSWRKADVEGGSLGLAKRMACPPAERSGLRSQRPTDGGVVVGSTAGLGRFAALRAALRAS